MLRSRHTPSLGRAYVQVGSIPRGASRTSTVAAKEDQDGDAHLQLARAFQALGRPPTPTLPEGDGGLSEAACSAGPER